MHHTERSLEGKVRVEVSREALQALQVAADKAGLLVFYQSAFGPDMFPLLVLSVKGIDPETITW